MKEIESLPQLNIAINDERVPTEKVSFLGEVRIQQRLSMPSLCELKFFFPAEIFFNDSPFKIGAMINLTIQGTTPE